MADDAWLHWHDEQLLDNLLQLSVAQLQQLIRYHNAAYFEHNAARISDAVFDRLVLRLQQLAPQSAVLQQLGEAVATGSEPVLHSSPMLSLDKCYDESDLVAWHDKIQDHLMVMPKIDGLACALRYNTAGALQLAATRGNGLRGEDVTHNVQAIAAVPTQLDATICRATLQGDRQLLEVRGEVYMSRQRFAQHYADQFANPRNLAAGALKQKDVRKSADYGLSFLAYEVLGTQLDTQQQSVQLLQQLGFAVPPHRLAVDRRQVLDACAFFVGCREQLDYETDGVVFRVNTIAKQQQLGHTAHHPRFCLAYKFQGEQAQTRLIGVEWSVGRTGVITPVALIDPVVISGARVARASLHNVGRMQQLGLTDAASIEVARRGGVIPHVQRVLEATAGAKPIALPSHCPSCGQPTTLEGDFLQCSQPQDCLRVACQRLRHFCQVVDLQGFGGRLIEQLVQRALACQPAQLYELTAADLLPLSRMGELLANKLVEEVNAKRQLPFATFLASLGLAEIGPVVAATLAQQFPTLPQLQQATPQQLADVPGVGPVIADSIVQGLRERSEEIDQLLRQIRLISPSADQQKSAQPQRPLHDKRVVFTGKLVQCSRKEAQQRVKALGGQTPAALSAAVDYLVLGEAKGAAASSKRRLAQQLIDEGCSIKMVSEQQFWHQFFATRE
ncbi:MAG: NAD-dependent DNA ligase LigA [Myxococcota bacterium]